MMKSPQMSARVLILALLLGVMTTYVVSCTFAVILSIPRNDAASGLSLIGHSGSWSVVARKGIGSYEIHSVYDHGQASDALRSPEAEEFYSNAYPLSATDVVPQWFSPTLGRPADEGMWIQIYLQAYGWPMPAFYWRWTTQRTADGFMEEVPLYGGIEVKDGQGQKIIPLMPVWGGLLVNSLAYGSLWLVLIRMIAPLLRRRRSQMGHCRNCEYDLHGSPSSICPECGTDSAARGYRQHKKGDITLMDESERSH